MRTFRAAILPERDDVTAQPFALKPTEVAVAIGVAEVWLKS